MGLGPSQIRVAGYTSHCHLQRSESFPLLIQCCADTMCCAVTALWYAAQRIIYRVRRILSSNFWGFGFVMVSAVVRRNNGHPCRHMSLWTYIQPPTPLVRPRTFE